MPIGDDATAAGMPVVLSGDDRRLGADEITKTRDFLANGPTYWKPGVTLPADKIGGGAVPVANGGTGATTAGDARTNLGITPAAIGAARDGIGTGLRFTSPGFGRIAFDAPGVSLGSELTLAGTTLPLSGGTLSGDLYIPGATAAGTGYTIMYIDGAGRLCRGASSEVFKDDIVLIDAMALGDIFPDLYEYVMKDDPGRWVHVGHIAERLDEVESMRRFVVYAREPIYEDVLEDVVEIALSDDGTVETTVVGQRVVGQRIIGSQRVRDANGNPIPESIDFIGLLLAQTAQLHARVAALEAAAS